MITLNLHYKSDKASAQANGLQWWDDTIKASVLKQFNNGAYSSMSGKPCIIVEWKNAGGDYVKDASGKRIGMVIFLDE